MFNSNPIKKHICILFSVVLLFFCGSIYSQDTSPSASYNTYIDSSQVLFHVIGGYSLSYSPDSMPLRYSLEVDLSFQDKDSEQINKNEIEATITEDKDEGEMQRTDYSLDFTTYYIYSFYKSKNIHVYGAAGPTIGYSYNKYEMSNIEDDRNYYYTHENSTKIYSAGVTTLFGVEGFISDNVSLVGEYRLRAQYEREDFESKSKRENDGFISRYSSSNEKSGWALDLSSVQIELAVYF